MDNYEIYSVEANLDTCGKFLMGCLGFELKWTANIGFGSLTFLYNSVTREWSYDDECMGKDFCKAVLNKWIDDLKSDVKFFAKVDI